MEGLSGKVIERNDPLFNKALSRLQEAKKDMADTRIRHTCSIAMCNPQSEPQLYGFQNSLSTNVYLCKYGAIHVCTAQSCTLFHHSHEQTCPISGFQHGTSISMYDKNNSKTWNLKLEHVYHGGGSASAPARSAGAEVSVGGAPHPAPSPARSAGEGAATKEADPPARSAGGSALKEPASGPPVPTKRRGLLPNMEDLQAKASCIVDLLLFSNARVARNNDAIKEMQAESEAARITYMKRKAAERQQPYWTDVYRLMGHFLSKPLPLTIFERNVSLHDYYVAIILQVWKRIQMFHVVEKDKKYDEHNVEIVPRIDFEQVALSTMYTMRQGMHVSGHVLLPKDDFLLLHLPVARDLSYFKLNKTCISKGDKIITQAYENAFNAKAPLTDILINLNELPVYKNEEAVEWVAGSNVPAKRDVSGVLLFMPQARPLPGASPLPPLRGGRGEHVQAPSPGASRRGRAVESAREEGNKRPSPGASRRGRAVEGAVERHSEEGNKRHKIEMDEK